MPTANRKHDSKSTDTDKGSAGWLAAGALAGAVLASACCVVPLALVMLGISGAWIANLTALEPYRPFTATLALILLGFGFWHVYFKPRPACENGSYCARPASARLTKTVLWIGLLIVILTLTLGWWAPIFY